MPENERQEKENAYVRSMDDVKLLRKEVSGLSNAIARIEEAITGDKFGNEGIVKQINLIKLQQELMNKRVEVIEEAVYQMKIDNKERIRNWGTVFALAGTVFGIVLKFIMDKISKK